RSAPTPPNGPARRGVSGRTESGDSRSVLRLKRTVTAVSASSVPSANHAARLGVTIAGRGGGAGGRRAGVEPPRTTVPPLVTFAVSLIGRALRAARPGCRGT